MRSRHLYSDDGGGGGGGVCECGEFSAEKCTIDCTEVKHQAKITTLIHVYVKLKFGQLFMGKVMYPTV